MSNNHIIQLSKYELWQLLSYQAPAVVIGFRNPMLGLLQEDIFPLVQECTLSLIEKKLIEIDINNQIKLNEKIAPLIQTLTSPEHTLLIGSKLNATKGDIVQSFNFSGNQIVLLREVDHELYSIQEISSQKELLSLILEPFSQKIFWAADSDPLYFSQDSMTMMQKSVESGDLNEAKKQIDLSKGDEQSKAHFWASVQHPAISSSLVWFFNRNNLQKKNVDGFAVIADDRYLWRIDVVDEKDKTVRVSKNTLKELSNVISATMPFSL